MRAEPRARETRPDRATAGGTGADLQAVMVALADEDCRGLLRTIGDDALTAAECAEAFELPLSTTYRKLERLAAAGLVEEGLRLRRDGKHTGEFERRMAAVSLSVDPEEGFDLSVTHCDA